MAPILFIDRGGAIAKNLGTLLLLLLLLPFNVALVLVSGIKNRITSSNNQQSNPAQPSKRILITGAKMTKALQLARSFHRDGHEVYLVETHK
ncbi:MAG: ATP-grasp enzyme, partial [Cyanobacteria bacterium P01_A01_bin.40]